MVGLLNSESKRLLNENELLKKDLAACLDRCSSLEKLVSSSDTTIHTLMPNLEELKTDNSAMKAELGEYKENLATWMNNCTSRFQDALFNAAPLPSSDHAIVVALRSAPHLNGMVVRLEAWHQDRERWQVQTTRGKILLLKKINLLRKPEEDEIDSLTSSDFDDVT